MHCRRLRPDINIYLDRNFARLQRTLTLGDLLGNHAAGRDIEAPPSDREIATLRNKLEDRDAIGKMTEPDQQRLAGKLLCNVSPSSSPSEHTDILSVYVLSAKQRLAAE